MLPHIRADRPHILGEDVEEDDPADEDPSDLAAAAAAADGQPAQQHSPSKPSAALVLRPSATFSAEKQTHPSLEALLRVPLMEQAAAAKQNMAPRIAHHMAEPDQQAAAEELVAAIDDATNTAAAHGALVAHTKLAGTRRNHAMAAIHCARQGDLAKSVEKISKLSALRPNSPTTDLTAAQPLLQQIVQQHNSALQLSAAGIKEYAAAMARAEEKQPVPSQVAHRMSATGHALEKLVSIVSAQAGSGNREAMQAIPHVVQALLEHQQQQSAWVALSSQLGGEGAAELMSAHCTGSPADEQALCLLASLSSSEVARRALVNILGVQPSRRSPAQPAAPSPVPELSQQQKINIIFDQLMAAQQPPAQQRFGPFQRKRYAAHSGSNNQGGGGGKRAHTGAGGGGGGTGGSGGKAAAGNGSA